MVEEEGDEEVSNVVGPAEEEFVDVLFEDVLDDNASLLYREIVEGAVEHMEGSRDGH